jgi:hypothetical protein
MAFSFLLAATVGVAKPLWRALAIASCVCTISLITFHLPSPADDNCLPVRNATFPAGSREEVAEKAAEFLIRVQDVQPQLY